MEIHRSARRHGVEDDTIVHAIEHALVGSTWSQRPIRLGCSPSDRTELGISSKSSGSSSPDQRPIVIHAMSLRPKFYDLLPGAEEEE